MDKALLIPVIAGTILFILVSVFINILILQFRKRHKQHSREVVTLKMSYEAAILQTQVEVQENTYRQIARELHDNVGQLLSTTKMLLGVTEIKLQTVPDTLVTANATLSKALEEIRFVSRSLDKEWLEQFDFLENLRAETDRINSAGLIKCTVTCSTRVLMRPEDQVILFRIVQEAIQNAVKHAGPTKLDIDVSQDKFLIVRVVNNGKILPPGFKGMGTNNIRHRTQVLGGKVQWHSANGETTVSIQLPIKSLYEN